MTKRRALQGTLERLRSASSVVKGLIVDEMEQGEAVTQDLIDVFWKLKDAEQALAAIVKHNGPHREAG